MSSASAPAAAADPAEQADVPALGAAVRKGALWSAVSTLLLRLSNIVITAVVAHILDPHDFGVFTIALTVYAVISALSEFGIASCLVRADLDLDAMAPTMVTVSWMTSAIFSAMMALFAPRIAVALGSADGTGPITVMALAVLISGFFAVPGAQLTRNFKQDKLFWANAISLVPSTAVLLILAKTGDGAMAFAWSRVVSGFVMGCVMMAVAPRFYLPGVDRAALSVLFRFGVPLAAANFVNFILVNVDYAFVGHLVGAVALGAYMLAFTLASSPGLLLGNVINSISMPAFSRVKHDPELLKSAMTGALRAISLILMPMCALMIALARPLVLALYGSRWTASAHVLAILATYGAISIVCILFANMLTSLGKAKFTFVVQVIWLGTLVPAMALGVRRDGITGAALAHIAVIGPIVLPCYLVVLKRATGIRLTRLGLAALPPLVFAVAAAFAATAAARAVAAVAAAPAARLAGGLAAGGAVYLIAAAPLAAAWLGPARARVLRPYHALARLLRLPVPVSPAVSAVSAVRAVFTPPYQAPWLDAHVSTMPMPRLDLVTVDPAAAGYGRVGARHPGGHHNPMSAPVAVRRRELVAPPARTAVRPHERATRRAVSLTWALLFMNALVFYGSALHIPSAVGKAITQGSLQLALLVALTVNRRLLVRPNVFLCLATLLALEAVITSLQPQHVGALYRTFRLVEFVAVLWLLSPWWGRRDLLLMRCHLTMLLLASGSVLLGLLVLPGHALGSGRLSGVLWDIPATEVAHYAAVSIGIVVLLWLSGRLRGRVAVWVTVLEGAMLLLSHTRTALIALVAGLLVAGLSLILTTARVRRFFVTAGIVVTIGVVLAAGVATNWLARGQSAQELASLTGRTDFWTLVVHLPRTRFQEIFGFGLSNGSVNGLPIDSNWLVAYLEQGYIGVIVCAAMLVFLLIACFFRPPGVERALALFLVVYNLIASFTQVGFGSATTYLLELVVAASLLVPSVAWEPSQCSPDYAGASPPRR